MENIKCQCDEGYNSCKGKIEQRNLKEHFQWDIKCKNYKLNLCDYHFKVIHYMSSKIIELLKQNA